jgi:hypothetical protein
MTTTNNSKANLVEHHADGTMTLRAVRMGVRYQCAVCCKDLRAGKACEDHEWAVVKAYNVVVG